MVFWIVLLLLSSSVFGYCLCVCVISVDMCLKLSELLVVSLK